MQPTTGHDRELAGQTAVVTGAGSGIGRATAQLLALHGAHVVAVDRRPEGLEGLVVEILAAGGSAESVIADVTDSAAVAEIMLTAARVRGSLDILVNNAGALTAPVPIAEFDERAFDRLMNVNVKGVFLGCKYGIPALRRNGGGTIINTASFVAILGAATPQLAYTSSKGAVLSMSKELAAIHARENIRVNALCPGPLRTELLMKYLDTEEKRQRRLVHVPMGRFGEAKEIANAVLFLASDEASFVTGATFLVDGGITCAYTTPLGEPK
jgi:NAD(P)-dependent dehydrogenase (short-subunit alcohol dehydrogenase family)